MISVVERKGEPMSWGIAETASEIEKIKSESADYLNGLNSCGVIDWNTYNYAFDFYTDLLMKAYEQGRKDAQPELCEDAVSREAAIRCCTFGRTSLGLTDELRRLPSVTPKRKTGKWIIDGHHIVCSECETGMCNTDREGDSFPTNFCPNCGADMRGERDESERKGD